eukprot:gnl/Spiro4/17356_TR9246_c0_g1_i1.p1 gnl/Spiro4/17356_TR9246_c0_g1~~gnl/Spiro4/17356_TR9246_c0_g1_i1.p1  ORF type:complete len:487 (-),score=83.28 gnl/Spiro4/17356_TR9246_c0_g1_i1:192-1460(-)
MINTNTGSSSSGANKTPRWNLCFLEFTNAHDMKAVLDDLNEPPFLARIPSDEERNAFMNDNQALYSAVPHHLTISKHDLQFLASQSRLMELITDDLRDVFFAIEFTSAVDSAKQFLPCELTIVPFQPTNSASKNTKLSFFHRFPAVAEPPIGYAHARSVMSKEIGIPLSNFQLAEYDYSKLWEEMIAFLREHTPPHQTAPILVANNSIIATKCMEALSLLATADAEQGGTGVQLSAAPKIWDVTEAFGVLMFLRGQPNIFFESLQLKSHISNLVEKAMDVNVSFAECVYHSTLDQAKKCTLCETRKLAFACMSFAGTLTQQRIQPPAAWLSQHSDLPATIHLVTLPDESPEGNWLIPNTAAPRPKEMNVSEYVAPTQVVEKQTVPVSLAVTSTRDANILNALYHTKITPESLATASSLSQKR